MMTRLATILIAAAALSLAAESASAQTPPGSTTGDMNRSTSGSMHSTKSTSTTGKVSPPGSTTGDNNRSATGTANSALGSSGGTATTTNGAAHKKLNAR